MADPLMSVPGLGGFLSQQRFNEESDINQLRARQGAFTLQQHFQEQQEINRARKMMESGKDPQGLILELMRLGPRGSLMAKQYADALQGAEQYGVMRDTREFLKKFQPQGGQPGQPGQQQQGLVPRGAHPLRQAAQQLAMTNPKAAEQLIDIARKVETQFGTTPHVLTKPDGSLVVGVMDQSGGFHELPNYKPGPQGVPMNLGDRVVMGDRRDTGATYQTGTSPAQADASQRGWAALNQPIYDAERGQFYARPRVGPGTPGGQEMGPQGPMPPYNPQSRIPAPDQIPPLSQAPEGPPPAGTPLGGPGMRERPLPGELRNQIGGLAGQSDLMRDQQRTFRDDFGGNFILGGLENTLKRWFPVLADTSGTKGQADWWSAMQGVDAFERHELFGSAFTAPERQIWRETSVTPRDHPDIIRQNLRRRGQVMDRVLQRVMTSAGVRYSREEIEQLAKRAIMPSKPVPPDTQPGTQDEAYRQRLMRAIEEEVLRKHGQR